VLPQTQAPELLQVSAVVPQLVHSAPPVGPQELTVGGEWHRPPLLQQPVGQVLALHTQLPPTQA
jgi:hypothetical protein